MKCRIVLWQSYQRESCRQQKDDKTREQHIWVCWMLCCVSGSDYSPSVVD